MIKNIKKSIFVPAVLGAVLLIASCAASNKTMTPSEMKALQPSGQIINGIRVVKVTAERYKFTPDPIVVRTGENVRVELTSKDTTHGFALPEYNIDVKVEPGKTSTASFTARNVGEFPIHCSVFCGLGHPSMRATLVVLPAGG
jgi:cytochrome c oxidase subunit II